MKYLFVLTVLLSGCIHLSWAEQNLTSYQRPEIALVLAGGGAKGAAHVGVLQALEELRVPVDLITGTSMGAYVGGLYATGMSAREVKDMVNSINWTDGYKDRVDRSYRRVRDKEFEDRYQINTDLGIRWIEVRVPKGVVQGQNMLRILRHSVGGIPELSSFNQLAIPYRSVATNIVTLKPAVIDHGYLVDAMMASMSVPGVLPPYKIGEQLLVDGGITDNLPVDVARQMGADTVIAIDISTDYKKEKDFTDFLTVADQLSNYLVRQSTQRQANLLSDKDIYLRPEVGDMETAEFDRMDEAYQKGYDAVMSHRTEFESLALSETGYQHYLGQKMQRTKAMKQARLWVFDQIRLDNQTHYSDETLKALLKIAPGQGMTQESIEDRIKNLYAFDRFELIHYQVEKKEGKTALVVSIREKSWGPNYVHFHFALEDDFNTRSQYSAGISSNFTALDSRGSELRLDLEMGTDRKLQAEYYLPVTQTQNIFSTVTADYAKEVRAVPYFGFRHIDLTATKNYLPVTYLTVGLETAIGYRYRPWDEFKLGVRYKYGKARMTTLSFVGAVDLKRVGLFGRYRLDTLDDFALPSHGLFINFDYFLSNDEMDNHSGQLATSYKDVVYEYSLRVLGATTSGRHTLVGNFEYGEVESQKSIVPIDPKTIGGLLHLSGIPKDSLIGQNKAFASLVYRYRWFDNNFGLFTAPVYLGASFEYGGVWSDTSLDYHNAPLYAAGSVFAGIDSPIGPVMLGYGRTEHNYDSVYFSVGHTF
ncbi:patatin-like phospholipase family protein [Vibrio quintilis]|uniref:NTE family protein RssA n=1 Tax=Vibrio quintilis TaxID=1117707 RepID=A0A1M7YRR5_9VIBR|nr:patatin-like phospholipase family protein [Vibrio quintilis]SHO55311.1 NTE family protein RssA [Vibrio quintilis]